MWLKSLLGKFSMLARLNGGQWLIGKAFDDSFSPLGTANTLVSTDSHSLFYCYPLWPTIPMHNLHGHELQTEITEWGRLFGTLSL